MDAGARLSAAAGVNKETADGGVVTTTLTASRALGAFLRRMRARPRPVAPGPGRRRVTGLRREEVAVAAGISAGWYTWLEQGRPVRTTPATLRALSRALALSAAEAAHLSRLAAGVGAGAPRWRRTVAASPALRALCDALPGPAYAVNGRWDVLHANAAAAAALGAFDAQPGVTDNVLLRLFLDPGWRTRFEDWAGVAASAVAQFRAATGHLVANPDWRGFVAGLAEASPDFANAWDAHGLDEAHLRTKRVRPGSGRGEAIHLLYASVAPDGEPDDVRLVLYAPADDEARRALSRLTSPGSRAASAWRRRGRGGR